RRRGLEPSHQRHRRPLRLEAHEELLPASARPVFRARLPRRQPRARVRGGLHPVRARLCNAVRVHASHPGRLRRRGHGRRPAGDPGRAAPDAGAELRRPERADPADPPLPAHHRANGSRRRRMTLKDMLLCAGFSLALPIGQTMFKYAAIYSERLQGPLLVRLIMNWPLIGALAWYGFTAIFWFYIL